MKLSHAFLEEKQFQTCCQFMFESIGKVHMDRNFDSKDGSLFFFRKTRIKTDVSLYLTGYIKYILPPTR